MIKISNGIKTLLFILSICIKNKLIFHKLQPFVDYAGNNYKQLIALIIIVVVVLIDVKCKVMNHNQDNGFTFFFIY